jgi:hypothetical protein
MTGSPEQTGLSRIVLILNPSLDRHGMFANRGFCIPRGSVVPEEPISSNNPADMFMEFIFTLNSCLPGDHSLYGSPTIDKIIPRRCPMWLSLSHLIPLLLSDKANRIAENRESMG